MVYKRLTRVWRQREWLKGPAVSLCVIAFMHLSVRSVSDAFRSGWSSTWGAWVLIWGCSTITMAWVSVRLRVKEERARKNDQEAARLALVETQNRLDVVLSHAPVIFWSTDQDGIITYSQGRGLAAFGFQPGQLVGSSVLELYKNDPVTLARLLRAFGGESFTHEANANESWFETHYFPMRDAEGRISGIGGAAIDITARKLVEAERMRVAVAEQSAAEIRQSQKFVDSLIEHLPSMVLVNEAQNLTFVRLNRAGEELLGMSKGEIVGKSYADLFGDETAELNLARDREIVAIGGLVDVREETVESRSLGRRVVRTKRVPVLDEDDQVRYLMAISEDITELKEIQEERDRFFTTSLDMLIVSGMDGFFKRVNPVVEAILGYTPKEFCEIPYMDLIHPDDIAPTAAEIERQKYGESVLKFENRYRAKDGTYRWLSWRSTPVGDRMYACARDVTEEKQTREELHLRERVATAASQAKSTFLANMSHEIRTPINGVMGMISLLLDTTLSSEQRDFAEKIRSSAETLLALVNDVLDLSKAESGKVILEQIDFDLVQVITDIEHTLSYETSRRGLKFAKEIDPSLPVYLVGDPTRLRQIVMNLVSNAIKFTPKGSITVKVFREGMDNEQDQVRLRFEVSDTGIGIPLEALDRIFQAFSQADNSTTRRYGGTGLGLSISKNFVSLMGGQIGVESKQDHGSIFWFTVSLKVGMGRGMAPNQAESSANVRQEKLRVLVAEDNSVNRMIAVKMLEKLGHTAVAVSNGLEAIAALRDAPYDIVLMDCQMPDMDGYEASRAIRVDASPELRRVPIVAITANAMSDDRDKCLAAGMNDYLAKPMRVGDLEKAINRNALRAGSSLISKKAA